MAINKVILLGNITKDVEIQKLSGEVSVAKFTLAVQRRYANEKGEHETDFINCVAWRSTAEVLGKYAKKGNKLGVVGSIQTRTYETQDGQKRSVFEVVVDEVEFLTPKTSGGEEKVETTKLDAVEIKDDTLPF